MIDAKLHETKFFYDRRDQLVKTINPLGDSTIYEYDINGNLVFSINPNSDSIRYEYDPLDRLIKKSFPGDSIFYLYDPAGNVKRIEDKNSWLSFYYDGSDRLIVTRPEATDTTGGELISRNLRYEYDRNNNVSSLRVFQPSGAPASFITDTTLGVGQTTYCVTSADFDGDGDIDLAVGLEQNDSVLIYKNDGTGHFSYFSSFLDEASPYEFFASDFDADGDIDLAIIHVWWGTISVFKNDGSGNFTFSGTYGVGSECYCINGGDLDNDGDIDLIAGDARFGRIRVYMNYGNGDFFLAETYSILTDLGSVLLHALISTMMAI